MPGGDGTGAQREGLGTGRGIGRCAGKGIGRGRGQGKGNDRVRRNLFYTTGLTGRQRAAAGMPAFGSGEIPALAQSVPAIARAEVGSPPAVSREQEVALLTQQAKHLGNTLDHLKKRLEQLQAQPEPQ